MLCLVFLALIVPLRASIINSVVDYFFNSFDGDKFENVGIGQTIECGEDSKGAPRDCLILCQNTNSCANSTFKVKSANIQIICQMPSSCANVYISATGTQSLNMSFMASKAFFNGYYIGTDNQLVITQCSFGESCKQSTFYYQDAEVYHNCSAWNGDEWSSYGACRDSNIVTRYGKVTLDFSNKQAFYPGTYFGYNNEDVTTYCRSSSGCESAVFHYHSRTPVKHYCMTGNSCAGAVIHALTRTDVDCAGVKGGSTIYSCYSTSIISPTNNYTVTVHGDDYAPEVSNRVHLYLTSSDHMDDLVICEDDCADDRIVYYAATDYNWEVNCNMENADDCLRDLRVNLESNPYAIYDNYYYDVEGRVDEVWSEGPLLVLHSKFPQKIYEYEYRHTPVYPRTSLTAPQGLDDNEYLVLCIDCKETDFLLSKAENAMIYTTRYTPSHTTWIEYSYMEASQSQFTFIGTSDGQNITVNATQSNEVNIVNVGMWSDIYLGEVLDVAINCTWSQACVGVDIYSDVNPIEEDVLSVHSEFQVECVSKSGASPCSFYSGYPSELRYGLYLHFSYLNKKCRIYEKGADTDECPFLDYSVSGVLSNDDTKETRWIYGLIALIIVVVLCVIGGIVYHCRKKKMDSDLYTNLSGDNNL